MVTSGKMKKDRGEVDRYMNVEGKRKEDLFAREGRKDFVSDDAPRKT